MTTHADHDPEGCTMHCGGSVRPSNNADAPVVFNCGIARFRDCPVIKSRSRGRNKRRRHSLGLWKRSRREFRLRIEAMVIHLEFPGAARKWPEGSVDRVITRAQAVGFDQALYQSLRLELDLRDAVDRCLEIQRPFTPRTSAKRHRP